MAELSGIATRILDLPVPRIAAHLQEVAPRLPAEQPLRKRGIRPACGDVARTPRDDPPWQLVIGRALERLAHFENRNSFARAEIDGDATRLCLKIVQGSKMTIRKILYMDEIADTGAVDRGIVAAENVQFRPPSDRDLQQKRHQVVRRSLGVLADQSAFMRADGVEVTQANDPPAGIGLCEIAEDVFLDESLSGHRDWPPNGENLRGSAASPARHRRSPRTRTRAF